MGVSGCGRNIIYDGCPATCGTTCSPKSTPCGNERFVLTSAGQLQSELPGHLCATVGKDDAVTLAACAAGSSEAQTWKYDNVSQQLTSNGKCVTSGGSGPGPTAPTSSLVLGRPLADKGFAVFFLNNKPNATSMTCDTACMARLGAVAGTSYDVTEVWSGKSVLTLDGGATLPTKTAVPADGGSVYYRLTPK